MTRTESSIIFIDNPNKIISDGGMTSISSGKPIMVEKEDQLPRTGEELTNSYYLFGIVVVTITILIILRIVKKSEREFCSFT